MGKVVRHWGEWHKKSRDVAFAADRLLEALDPTFGASFLDAKADLERVIAEWSELDWQFYPDDYVELVIDGVDPFPPMAA